MLQPPKDEQSLAAMWARHVRNSSPLGVSPEEIENARVMYMQGAIACLWLLARLAGPSGPASATRESFLDALGKVNEELAKFMAGQPQPH